MDFVFIALFGGAPSKIPGIIGIMTRHIIPGTGISAQVTTIETAFTVHNISPFGSIYPPSPRH